MSHLVKLTNKQNNRSDTQLNIQDKQFKIHDIIFDEKKSFSMRTEAASI